MSSIPRSDDEAVLDDGYAQFAKEFNAPDADSSRRAARDRYIARTEEGIPE